jgi:hypothetical protein
MSQVKAQPSTNYAAALLRYLEPSKPKPKLPRQPRRGRPPALGTIRHKGQFLKAIAEINSANRKRWSCLAIASELHKRPEYRHLSVRHLRDEVAAALKGLTELPPDRLQHFLSELPPEATAKMTTQEIEREIRQIRRELRRMALETLRYHLKANKRN